MRRIACPHAGSVVCRRPPSMDAIPPMPSTERSPRVARVAQREKLRIAQRFGVWRHDHHCQIGRVGGSGHLHDGFSCSNSVFGRRVQINFNVGSDRSSRSEETLPCSWIRWHSSHQWWAIVKKIGQVRIAWCSNWRGLESGPSTSQTPFR